MVLEQNNLEQKTKELDELIDLAEEVSLRVKLLDSEAKGNLRVITGLMTLLCIVFYLRNFKSYASDNGFIIFIFIIIVVVCPLLIFLLVNQYRKNKKEIKQETTILNKLHDMITVHKNGFESELGIVSNAIFEMKLSRIEFNFDNVSKNPFFRLITSILG